MSTRAVVKTSQGKPTMAYACARRKLGIFYVGTLVVLSVASLFLSLPAKIFGTIDASPTAWIINISACLIVFNLFSLPIDLVGFMIEKHYQRSTHSLVGYLKIWISASTRYVCLFFALAGTLTALFHFGGIAALIAGACSGCILLIASQTSLASFYSGMQFVAPPQELKAAYSQSGYSGTTLMVCESDELCFSGGITGLPGSEIIVIPSGWVHKFNEQQLWAEIERRNLIIKSGGRNRGLILALASNLIGILICAQMTSSIFSLRIDSLAGLITMSLCFTLWFFNGLLLMPYPSQLGTIEADRLAVESGVDRKLLIETMEKIDSYLEDEKNRSRTVDSIFHPIPTVSYRLAMLESQAKTKGAWHAARYTILLSIFGLSLLGRAVHCNAGKPDLWAMLPAD